MDYGFNIPTRGPLASTQNILAMAKRGEELGFAFLAIPDHIVIPRTIDSLYPYSQNRKMTGAASGDCLEPLAVMAYLAAATSKTRLLTSVMVVPHRPPVYTAKALASIDVLSNGRVVLGVGAGWMEEEFRAIGAPPFAERGKVTDEYLQIFKELWTKDDPKYSGQYASFDHISFLPKPLQQPHPPIWVGGESPAALRRTARLGDAWYPIGTNPQFPLNTLQRFKDAIGKLHAEANSIGRNPAEITLTYWAMWQKDGNLQTDTGERHLFCGSDEQVAADIRAFQQIGVKHLLFNFQRGSSLGDSLAAMEHFATRIAPLAA